MHINDLKESNYLKKEDCDPPIKVTIAHLEQTNVALESDPPDMKWTLHFKEQYKPMVLNSTNAQLIAQALGSEETDDWSGKQIVLYKDPNVSFRGKLVGGVRARAVKKTAQPAPPQDPDEDDIPF